MQQRDGPQHADMSSPYDYGPPMSTIPTSTPHAMPGLLPPLPHYPGHFATAAHAQPPSYLAGGYVVASDTVQHWPTPPPPPPAAAALVQYRTSDECGVPYTLSNAAYSFAGGEVPWQRAAMPEPRIAPAWRQQYINNNNNNIGGSSYMSAQGCMPQQAVPQQPMLPPHTLQPAATMATPLAQMQGVRYALSHASHVVPRTDCTSVHPHETEAATHVGNEEAAVETMSIAHSARRLSTAKRSAATVLGSATRSAYKTRGSHGSCTHNNTNNTNNNNNTSDPMNGGMSSTTATTSNTGAQDESCCVAAVINNGGTEVGVALCALPSLTVSIAQYGDSCTFAKTLTLLYTQNPIEVLVPATTVNEPFTQTLLRCFAQEMTFTAVQRRFYQSEAGVRRLHELRSSAELTGSIEDTDRYLCVAAANALLAYMEDINDMQFVPGSVRIRCMVLEQYAEIPRASARALHIIPPAYDCPALVMPLSSVAAATAARRAPWAGNVTNLASTTTTNNRTAAGATQQARRQRHRHHTNSNNNNGRGGEENANTYNNNDNNNGAAVVNGPSQFATPWMLRTTTLIDALPRTCTLHGQRFLRSSLLQPLRDRTAIQLRQDVVAWLLDDLHRALRLRGTLQPLAGLDMERLIASFSQRPRCMTSARRQQLVQSLLDLWHVLDVLQALALCLQAYLPQNTQEERNTPCAQRSTPQRPLLLQHIADTLRQCELPSLAVSLADYLDASVRTAILSSSSSPLEQTKNSHKNRTGARRWAGERAAGVGGGGNGGGGGCNRRVVLGAAQAAMSYTMSAASQSPQYNTMTSSGIMGGVQDGSEDVGRVREEGMRRALLSASYDMQRPTPWQPRPATASSSSSSSSSSAVFALLRICFAVRAPAGSVLDASRSGFSAQIGRIADYHARLRQAFQLYSLVLRPDPMRLYCLSYSAAEEAKTRGGPFKYKYTGKEDYARFLRAQLVQQQQQQQRTSNGMMRGPQWMMQQQQGEGVYGDNTRMPETHTEQPSSPYTDYEDTMHAAEESVGLQRQARRRLQRLRVQCTTDELEVLCAEARRYCEAILVEESRALQPLLDTLRGCIGKLQAMTEAVALLDMLLSFASYALMHRCVRPVLVDRRGRTTECEACGQSTSGVMHENMPAAEEKKEEDEMSDVTHEAGEAASPPTAAEEKNENTRRTPTQPFTLVLARHPSQYLRDEPGALAGGVASAVPNSLRWADGVHVLLVTGPNTTGKTTLLRQTGQLVALAQAGCFIPAQSARLFIADRIVAHMLCDELPSVTQSSFKRELSELAALSHVVTQDSLVLIDELGRSCASRQGFILAWATVRFLCARGVHALFTTHALGLTELAMVLPAVDNVHFSEDALFLPASTDKRSAVNGKELRATVTRCAHCLQPGPCTRQQYGVALAAAIGLPRPIIEDATQLLAQMQHVQVVQQTTEEGKDTEAAAETGK